MGALADAVAGIQHKRSHPVKGQPAGAISTPGPCLKWKQTLADKGRESQGDCRAGTEPPSRSPRAAGVKHHSPSG